MASLFNDLCTSQTDLFIIYSCGHLYHAPCLSASHPTLGVSCLLCDKSSKASDRSRAVAVRSWVSVCVLKEEHMQSIVCWTMLSVVMVNFLFCLGHEEQCRSLPQKAGE